MYSIDIDIGGTFTDGFFTDGTDLRTEKVLTTPHDITECFMNCVAAGSAAFDLDLSEFLRRTSVTRVSTTVGTNLLVQRAGPKLGLIVTKGNEATLYGARDSDVVGRYLPADMVRGIDEQVDDKGKIVTPAGEDEVLAAVRDLIQGGARMIVVSLKNSWRNAQNERAVRDFVRERYPVHYLRSVPIQIGTEVMHVDDDHARTNSAVFNAYIHSEMARTLYRAEDRLRAAGYERPLLVVHSSGGNARVAKTVALHTLHSGPAVAARGSAVMAKMMGLKKVVTTDMGGTSLDMSVVLGGEASFNLTPNIDGIPVATPMIEVESLGAGGGSIAKVVDGALKVGPESAGSAPGPVCYGKGGMDPTVTDANLLLGYIDPETFLGGRMVLDVEMARRVAERGVARHMDLSVEQAAFDIRDAINGQMAQEILARLDESGQKPGDFAMFSFGGSGPLHACALAEKIGIKRIVAFPYGSVFSAFGGNTTSVRHAFAMTLGIPVGRAAEADAALDGFRDQASRDMAGEGFPLSDLKLTAEIDLANGKSVKTLRVPGKAGRVSATLSKNGAKGTIRGLRLTAECDVPHWSPPVQAKAKAGKVRQVSVRDVFWRRDETDETPVFDRFSLRHGHRIDGPAIVEGPDTSYAIAPGWTLEVDGNGTFVMVR